MKWNCDLLVEDLIAYHDGELRGARLEYTEAHIRACDICRERSAAFEETGRLLDESTPLVDDAQGRVALMGQIYELDRREDQTLFARILPGLAWRRKTVAIASPFLVLILVLAILWPTPLDTTASSISTLLHYSKQRVTGTVIYRDDLPGERAEGIPRDPVFVAPTQLPLGLELVGTQKREGEHLSLQYEDGDQVTIILDQTPSGDAADSVSMETAQIARVNGTDILWLRGPRRGTVSAMLWERHKVVFSLMVLEAPPAPDAGLELEDALTVVKSVMEQQRAEEAEK